MLHFGLKEYEKKLFFQYFSIFLIRYLSNVFTFPTRWVIEESCFKTNTLECKKTMIDGKVIINPLIKRFLELWIIQLLKNPPVIKGTTIRFIIGKKPVK